MAPPLCLDSKDNFGRLSLNDVISYSNSQSAQSGQTDRHTEELDTQKLATLVLTSKCVLFYSGVQIDCSVFSCIYAPLHNGSGLHYFQSLQINC